MIANELARQRITELEDLYHNAPVGLCLLDCDLRFIRINERLAEINDIPTAEHFGRTLREVVPVLDRHDRTSVSRGDPDGRGSLGQ